MKKMRTRLLSLLLVLVTVLSLLPTSALAASGSGTGIKPTDNTDYWTTRLLHDGTPYSYKPPMAAGKLLYCLDRGYGYRWGTASFLNSYTYTSATGADADAVLKTALAQSGMGELDAQQLENFKWMMTYIVDYKGEIPGSLFMAAQTYVWDHQTFKGEGDGDIDAGGYANADTYEMYMGYIDWMLNQKAKEDAEFQKQIEEYAAQGKVASVVEDDAAKWAVWAKSSVKGRQSFFSYYAPRKLSLEAQPGEPDRPPAGDADITLKKVAAGTTRGLDGAKFNIYRDGQIVGSDVTRNGGIIEVKDVTKGLWTFVEVEAPEGYALTPTSHSVYVDTTDGDKQYTVTAENHALPDMKITKRDAMSGKPIAGTVFSIKSVTGSYSTSVTTGVDGSATLSAIPADVPNLTLSYHDAAIERRVRLSSLMMTAYHAGINVFTITANSLAEPSTLFITAITRSRGHNPWGSARVGAIAHLGSTYYAVHYIYSGIGRMAVNDELAAFHNHTNFGKDTQRAFLFAGASYADIMEELKTRDEKRDAKLIRYSEAYRGLHYPVHLLSCDETGARQLQIMAVPDYRVKLAKLMLRSAYRPPPEDTPAWDATYQNRPFVIGADMNLRRIDAAIASAKKRDACRFHWPPWMLRVTRCCCGAIKIPATPSSIR